MQSGKLLQALQKNVLLYPGGYNKPIIRERDKRNEEELGTTP
jgi:hypothetical protein